MFFGRKNKKLVEAPLYYWERKSYMLVILNNEEEDFFQNSMRSIERLSDVFIKENNYSIEDNSINLVLVYDNVEYKVGFSVVDVSVSESYLNKDFLFSENDKMAILNASRALNINVLFSEDEKKSYQLQLKLAVTMVPDMLGVLDESAEKMLPAKWVKMTAESNVLPNPKDLFSVQAVVSDDKKVWLHTHGLCRCGITELEILESDVDNYQSHYNLLSAYAIYLLDNKKNPEVKDRGAYIGLLINNQPVVVTCVSWTKAILEYKRLKLGGNEDRKNGHNSRTSVIFLYKSEEDERNGVLSKVNIYDKLWGENPIFFISDEETTRMKNLAIERFDYVKKSFKNKDNQVIIKIGLPLEEDGSFEHIWFELLEIKGNKFKAKLTQEPYNIANMHTGDEGWYTKDDVTDWLIYTKDYSISPDNVYLLDDN